MLGLNAGALSDELAWQVTPDQWWCLPIARPRDLSAAAAAGPRRWRRHGWSLAPVAPLAAFGLGLVLLYSRAAVPFLYFQF